VTTAPVFRPRATRQLSAADRVNVQALLGRVAEGTGSWPLADQLAADLATPGAADDRPVSVLLDPPVAALDATSGMHEKGGDDVTKPIAGYAQASRGSAGWTMQVVTDPVGAGEGRHLAEVGSTIPDVVATAALVATTVEAVADAGGGVLDWWVTDRAGPGAGRFAEAIDAIAVDNGFEFDRDLVQMRRALPADRRSTVATRAFVPGHDDESWLDVNNRAFAGHAEQGTWTVATLHQRTSQPWFDAAGFRLHERDGRLAAFCWTKVHDDTDVPIGEIYVIGVDPDFQGLGLGCELTLAGLDYLGDTGITDALLYVDGANVAARGMYERLGFQVQRTDRAYRRHV